MRIGAAQTIHKFPSFGELDGKGQTTSQMFLCAVEKSVLPGAFATQQGQAGFYVWDDGDCFLQMS